jgi:hypothetical protein
MTMPLTVTTQYWSRSAGIQTEIISSDSPQRPDIHARLQDCNSIAFAVAYFFMMRTVVHLLCFTPIAVGLLQADSKPVAAQRPQEQETSASVDRSNSDLKKVQTGGTEPLRGGFVKRLIQFYRDNWKVTSQSAAPPAGRIPRCALDSPQLFSSAAEG